MFFLKAPRRFLDKRTSFQLLPFPTQQTRRSVSTRTGFFIHWRWFCYPVENGGGLSHGPSLLGSLAFGGGWYRGSARPSVTEECPNRNVCLLLPPKSLPPGRGAGVAVERALETCRLDDGGGAALPTDRGLEAEKRKVALLVFWFRLASACRGSGVTVGGSRSAPGDNWASLSWSCCTSWARRSTGWRWLEVTGWEKAWGQRTDKWAQVSRSQSALQSPDPEPSRHHASGPQMGSMGRPQMILNF